MTSLPIVARELRVASRRKTTFIVRSVVPLLGLLAGFPFIFLSRFVRFGSVTGAMNFAVVGWYSFFITLVAGVFLASDCLSEERREGTLGFLFLTDLKGYDVVLGKFAAVSLNAFYGLLALFPVLGISLLMGGVTAGEFWRACLALVNTLFFAVASSMCVSALSKSSYRAMACAICLILGFLTFSVIALMLPPVNSRFDTALFCLGALSPLFSIHYSFAANYVHGARAYWSSLAICNGGGWLFLGLASWRLKSFRGTDVAKSAWQRLYTLLVGRTRRRGELLAINPVLWLLDDSTRLRWVAWGLAIAGGAALLISAAMATGFPVFFANMFLAVPFYFLLKVFFAIQACRFFSESRRTGSFELLCCTPMPRLSILSGQWMALRRIFLWPVAILIVSHLARLFFLPDLDAIVKNAAFNTGNPMTAMEFYSVVITLKQVANSIADFFALGWFGMWLALSLQKPGSATGWTILFVLVLPAIVSCVPTLATDAVFIVIGYSKLQQDFRAAALWLPVNASAKVT